MYSLPEIIKQNAEYEAMKIADRARAMNHAPEEQQPTTNQEPGSRLEAEASRYQE